MFKSRPASERFWEKVDKDGPTPSHCPELGQCWVWVAGIGGDGYGRFRYEKQKMRSHRYAWMEANGQIASNVLVCHKCDNCLCVRPDHLFVGSVLDNTHDRLRKGRQRRRLTDDQIREIRSIYQRNVLGCGYTSVARMFDVDARTVWNIVNGESWEYVE
jgi:hypothetical protein